MLSKILRLIPLTTLLCWPAIAAPPRPIPDDLVMSMQRGNCEGGCPVYRILIFANGDVIWQGRARVARLGVVLSTIERDQIRTLLEGFDSVDYFKLENIYGFRGSGCTSQKPDTPMVITSLSMGGLAKTLSHHDGCVGEVSEKLTALEDSIDKAVNAERWITGKSSGKKP
jgi:hypothetical protein